MPTKERESEAHEVEGTVVTSAQLMKWGGFAFTIVSAMVSLVWFAAHLKGDALSLQQEVDSLKREVETRNANQDKEIDKLKDRADSTEKSLGEMARKLDVAVAILERIEKKVNNSN
jgi:cell division protein FtsL